VTSISDPARTITVRDLAVSPPTRDYKRFLYAIDREAGSLAVFDVTDPKTASRTPMRRPHPELNLSPATIRSKYNSLQNLYNKSR